MNWKIGDKAIIVGIPIPCNGHDINGTGVTITSCEEDFSNPNGGRVAIEHIKCVAGIGRWIRTKYIQKIDDDYDGLQLTQWDECPWQPEKVTV